MSLPKDVQDRLTFDIEAASFLAYLIRKAGMDKARELVNWNRDGKSSIEFVTRAEVLGPDLEEIEKDWQGWVKAQKSGSPGIRIMTNPTPAPARPPE